MLLFLKKKKEREDIDSRRAASVVININVEAVSSCQLLLSVLSNMMIRILRQMYANRYLCFCENVACIGRVCSIQNFLLFLL